MLKKKNKLTKQLVIKFSYNKFFIEQLVTSSLKKNHFLSPLIRISFFAKENRFDSWHSYFSTYQHLLCPISLSNKVPSRAFQYSRFFFNKQLNYLTISNTLK